MLDRHGIPTGEEEFFAGFAGPFGDRIFDDGFAVLDERPSFSLWGTGRRITVEFLAGFPYAQIFAPPGKDFVAIEPMTAPTNALGSGRGLRIVEAGAEFRTAFRIGVEKIKPACRPLCPGGAFDSSPVIYRWDQGQRNPAASPVGTTEMYIPLAIPEARTLRPPPSGVEPNRPRGSMASIIRLSDLRRCVRPKRVENGGLFVDSLRPRSSPCPPKVHVSSLLETSILTAMRQFEFRDGGLGVVWPQKSGAATSGQLIAGKGTILDTRCPGRNRGSSGLVDFFHLRAKIA